MMCFITLLLQKFPVSIPLKHETEAVLCVRKDGFVSGGQLCTGGELPEPMLAIENTAKKGISKSRIYRKKPITGSQWPISLFYCHTGLSTAISPVYVRCFRLALQRIFGLLEGCLTFEWKFQPTDSCRFQDVVIADTSSYTRKPEIRFPK